ncbi:alpha/beta hydrolase family protein [Herbiconiux ginsengi]|uniref:Lysophospholipase, alpha-beta hydrolase superfamily n=1 Tax=Herbiconiux ginsengi TaxID=381665 RepID=A0A1H3PS22_9MICO|nr:alpha/beta fold hydrolase [Herbiconiux ginsengi]SDZ03209.1 Lysophospholipase, alpha-beta hydrolase superfamily [Herbiconiux ginsengi]
MSPRASEPARVPAWAVVALAAGTVATLAAAGGAVLTALMSRAIVIPSLPVDDVRILGYDEEYGTVALSVSADSILPGLYSLRFSGDTGHARLGEVLSVSDGIVVRSVIQVDYGDLGRARNGRISGWYYIHPRELDVPVDEVEVFTSVGPAPAWFVPSVDGSRSKWVIQVHGRGVRRGETIRAIPVFRERGYNTLSISYRNDGEAPRSSDGRYALGDTEWQDLDAAITYAVDHGATDIVLMGWSMGGAIALQAMGRAVHRDRIRAIALESPAVDWRDVLRYHGRARHAPELVGDAAFATVTHPWGRVVTGQDQPLDLDRLDFVKRSDEVDVPVLILHSDDDGYVPSTGSRKLAEARPDLVTFVPFSVARHTKLWNYDRAKWTTAIDGWLAANAL